ncbi:leucine-rich repeat domain-containing protein [Roseiconus lacunae]|uniref:Internalin-A n=1 Tax=Roseiconus lacunae TaxID=2605694 RepID=A0ABT7PBZ2_9BACT|nr:hypothetical protein [Roseiconus lacunae]MDM4014008.1 hypothetical protein [Roseiconus lacunae]
MSHRLSYPGLLFALLLGLTCAGCQPNRSSEDGTEPTAEKKLSEDDQSAIDVVPIAAQVEKAAVSVRRDENDKIIEVSFRGSSVGDVAGQLSLLPKLRSVLLSGSNADDATMAEIGKITTLENLDLRGCAISDAGLSALSKLPRLKAIKLSRRDGQTKVTAEGASALGQIKSLKVIALDFLPIGDAGVRSLSELPELRELYLAGTSLTDQSAETLAGFDQLTKLRLASNDLSGETIRQLVSVQGIAELDISDCPKIDSASITELAGFSELAKLNLYATGVGEGDWESLAKLNKLQWLNVDKTDVNDAALDGIGKLESLTFLHLGSTKITDAGMPRLANLKHLRKLIVTRTAVTQAGVDGLQDSLPTTEIQLEYVEGK